MKTKPITSIGLVAIGIALGLPLGFLIKKEKLVGELSFRGGNLYTEEKIVFHGTTDFELIYEVVHSVEVEGTSIHGKIISISVEDVAMITEVVKGIVGVDPILSVRVIDREAVEVTTGVVRGPLNGGGRIYSLKKVAGEWEIDESKGTTHWMSKTKGKQGESGQLRSLRSLRATS